LKKIKFDKVIRSKLIDDIIKMGGKPSIKDLSDEEYIKELYKQLISETGELTVANPEQLAEEIADVYEVLEAIASHWKIERQDIENAKQQKKELKGGFEDKRKVEYVEIPDDYFYMDYYKKNADRYPEIKDSK
jgi:predicted house-cleaning noncanonical NTP pyrophosphatase (MazG superfamily)